MAFYPTGTHVPDELLALDFLLRPLRATDVDLDYEAVMENPATLRLSGGGTWPADDFTRAANLADLVAHEQEHRDGVAFTYTVMNRAQSQCLGCVYVNQLPPTHHPSASGDVVASAIDGRQAIVRFWVRHSRFNDELDWRLLRTLIEWFGSEWRFSRVYFRAHSQDRRQQSLMARAGLPLAFSFEIPNRKGPFLAYGPVERPKQEGTQ